MCPKQVQVSTQPTWPDDSSIAEDCHATVAMVFASCMWVAQAASALCCTVCRLTPPLRPPPQVPLLLGTTILKGFQGWRHKRRMKRRVTDPNLAQNRKEVTLEWDSLECTLTDKQGRQRILLDNLQGSARPGRWV